MGPDGQQMEYTTHTAQRPNAAPADYVPTHVVNSRPPPPHFPPDGTYDPTLVQDPYGYTRGALPPDPAGKTELIKGFLALVWRL
jgi:hypothetical protein